MVSPIRFCVTFKFTKSWIKKIKNVLENESLYYLFTYLKSMGHDRDLPALPGWLSGERLRLLTWWLGVRYPVHGNFLCGIFLPLTSAEACEKSSWWLWEEKLF